MSSDESVGPLFFGPTSTGAAYRVPTAINSLLRPYQRDGAKFLFNGLFARHGALLCDEMGLGKTIQVIALLSALFHKTSSSESQGLLDDIYVNNAPSASTKSLSRRSKCDYPVLLLAPGSLLRQWAAELHAWGDYCSSKFLVAIAHGNTRASAIDDAEAGRVEIVITTYSTYQQQSELFDRVKWRLVVCDEIHILKNGKSIVSESVSSLVHQIRKAHEGSTSLYGCVGLTGTPVQNSLDELFCTVNCVLPGILGSIEMFRAHFVRPIKLTLDSTPLDVELERQRAKQLVSIMQIISLRRTKSLIASQLPNKTDSVVFCQMSEVQLRAYQRLLDSPDFMVLKSMRKQCECQSERGIYQCCHAEEIKTGIIWKHFHPFDRACERCPSCIVLPCLIMLAKLANHIDLLKPSSDCTADNREFATSITRLAFGNELQSQNGPISDQQCSTFSEMLQATTGTGKMQVLAHLLRQCHRNSSRVLLFSNSTRILDLIQTLVVSQGFEYRRLDGSSSLKQRAFTVKEFQQGHVFALLMTTKVGGVGLNLTAADVVILFDPNWNPAHDLQAQDRAWRIGSTKDVHVYRLISANSIEENIYHAQVVKQGLQSAAMMAASGRRLFSASEIGGIDNLLRFQAGALLTDAVADRETVAYREQIKKALFVQFDNVLANRPPIRADAEPGEDDSPPAGSADDEFDLNMIIDQFVQAPRAAAPDAPAPSSNQSSPESRFKSNPACDFGEQSSVLGVRSHQALAAQLRAPAVQSAQEVDRIRRQLQSIVSAMESIAPDENGDVNAADQYLEQLLRVDNDLGQRPVNNSLSARELQIGSQSSAFYSYIQHRRWAKPAPMPILVENSPSKKAKREQPASYRPIDVFRALSAECSLSMAELSFRVSSMSDQELAAFLRDMNDVQVPVVPPAVQSNSV